MNIIRKSVFEAYTRCPRLAYHMMLTTDVEETSMSAVIGRRFHEFAAKFFDRPWYIPEDFVGIEREMAERFVQLERRRFELMTLDEWKPLEVEIYLQDDKLGISGHIDRVDWYDRSLNTVSIIEYKTTERMDERQIRRELTFYVVLWKQCRSEIPVQIVCYNPRIDELFVDVVQESSIKNVLKWLAKIRESERTNNWPVKPHEFRCFFCDIENCEGRRELLENKNFINLDV